MTKELATLSPIEELVIRGDLSKLNAEQRVAYVRNLCEHLGLNALTQPFEYLTLSGRLVLYARKSCTDQLRVINGVSVTSLVGKNEDGIYVVTATGTNAKGRTDTATGAVPIENLKGESRANAIMKAETKAKRRLTLSLCGLGVLDESEIESIPNAVSVIPEQPKALPAPTEPHASAPTTHDEWTDEKGYPIGTVLVECGGYVKSVREVARSKPNATPAWTLHGIIIEGEAEEIVTFSDTCASIAALAHTDDCPVGITYYLAKTKGGKDSRKAFRIKISAK